MLKTSSKRAIASAALSAIAFFVSGPVLADTFTTPPTTTLPTKEGTGIFVDDANSCPRILALANTVQGRMNDLLGKLEAKADERDKQLVEMRKKYQEGISDRRVAWDARWDKLVLDLQAKAKTDADKAAIAQFRLDMVTAFAARKTAVENANAAFRTGIDDTVIARRKTIKASVERLQIPVKAAFDRAKTDCAANLSNITIKANLKASLDAAYATYRLNIQAAVRVGENAKALAETRTEAVKKADATFKASAEKNRTTLKAKLKV